MDQKYTTQFDARIRDEWVVVEAYALADHEGVFQTGITGVYLEGVNVMGLLTNYDVAELDAMIPDALENDASDARDQSRFEREHSARALG